MTEYSNNYKMGIKQRNWLLNVPRYTFNILRGAAQSSKSVTQALALALLIENSAPEACMTLCVGYSASSAFNNIVNCGGFGLKSYFGSRATVAKYQGNLALKINLNGHIKWAVCFGGNTFSAGDSFHGYAVDIAIAVDEADRLSPEVREEILERVQAHPGAKLLYTSNPGNPSAAYFKWCQDLIDRHNVNFSIFTLKDNPALSAEDVSTIMARYDPNSVFYKRYILGENCIADGAAFTVFPYTIIDEPHPNYSRLYIVADTGETKSATGIIAAGLYYDKGNYYADIIGEYYWLNADHPYNPKRFPDTAKDIAAFVKLYFKQLQHYPDNIIIDESPELYKNVLDAFRADALPTSGIKYPIKDTDAERVKRVESMLYMNRLHVCKSCIHTISALQNATFDTKFMDRNGAIKLSNDYNSEGHGDLLDCVSYFTKWVEQLF